MASKPNAQRSRKHDDKQPPKSLHRWLEDRQGILSGQLEGIPLGDATRVQSELDLAITGQLRRAVKNVRGVTERQFIVVAGCIYLSVIVLRKKGLGYVALEAACTGAAVMLAQCMPAILRK